MWMKPALEHILLESTLFGRKTINLVVRPANRMLLDGYKLHMLQAPDPRRNLTLPTGAIMPLGPLVQRTPPPNQYWHLNYNEYIVFDPNRVALRYLVQFEA